MLAAAAVLCSAAGYGQTLPEWLESMNHAADKTEPGTTETQTREAAAPEDDTARPPAEVGPLIEEYVITAHGVETVDQRNARYATEAAVSEVIPAENAAPPAAVSTVDELYSVQPSDVLQISVWREPELAREVVVSPDGRINYPLIGSVLVEGKSVEQIGDEIEAGLTKYMKQAPVTVTIKEVLGNRIYVLGQVNRPGAFPFSKSLDVVQALSLAGGAAKFADLDDIKILRRIDGVMTSFVFDYSQVENGRKLEQNILLETGDVIMVP
jgi:polysaccharide export outer membrane protein